MSEHSSNLPDFDTLQDGDEITVRGVVRIDPLYRQFRDVEFYDGVGFVGAITMTSSEFHAVAVSVTRKAVAS